MKKRSPKEKGELLARVASGKNLFIVAAVLVASLAFMGSPALMETSASLVKAKSPASEAAPAYGEAIGGTASASLDGISPGQVPLGPAGESGGGPDRGLYYSVYTVKPGDTAGAIAESYGVSVDSIVSFNNIQNTRALRPRQLLKVPSMAGILCVAKEGDTAESLARAWEIAANGIIESNGLLALQIPAGKVVFLPDARLPSNKLREINGDLFKWPIRGWVTSRYGWRSDPFTGSRSFHDGLDIGANLGTPIGAAMEGRVIEKGYSSSFGNYVLIAHHSNWMSFYGHMNSSIVKEGQWVGIGQRIGFVGNTGYSTGPHLHFSVFKNGRGMNPTVVLH